MTPPEIRRADPGDVESLLVLCRRFNEIEYQPFDEEVARSAFEALLESDRLGFVLVAGLRHQPIGYAVVTWGHSIESGGRDALLDELYVEERGRGIGSELMEEAMEFARAAGATRMFLETEARNRRARMFYARHDFEIEDSVWMSRRL